MPINKVWTTNDLHDTDDPEWFVLALFLLYQKLRWGGGVRTLYLGSSIHIRYSGLSVHQQRKIDKMMESFMDGEELSAAIEGRWKGQV